MEKIQLTIDKLSNQWAELAKQLIAKYDNNVSLIQQVKTNNGVAELTRFVTHIRDCQETFFDEKRKVFENAEMEGFINYKTRLKSEIGLMYQSMELIDIIQMKDENNIPHLKINSNTQEIIIIVVLIIACAITFAFS